MRRPNNTPVSAGWFCFPTTATSPTTAPVRYTSNGLIECMSPDGLTCYWSSMTKCRSIIANATSLAKATVQCTKEAMQRPDSNNWCYLGTMGLSVALGLPTGARLPLRWAAALPGTGALQHRKTAHVSSLLSANRHCWSQACSWRCRRRRPARPQCPRRRLRPRRRPLLLVRTPRRPAPRDSASAAACPQQPLLLRTPRPRMLAGPGSIVTMVGTVGVLGTSDNVPASNATITNPASIAYDRSGNLFIAEGNTGLSNDTSNRVYQVGASPRQPRHPALPAWCIAAH
jgi:hypothetical protein